MKTTMRSEYRTNAYGTEVCTECGHRWEEDGPGHTPDCRFYWHEDESTDWELSLVPELAQVQLSLFRNAA